MKKNKQKIRKKEKLRELLSTNDNILIKLFQKVWKYFGQGF